MTPFKFLEIMYEVISEMQRAPREPDPCESRVARQRISMAQSSLRMLLLDISLLLNEDRPNEDISLLLNEDRPDEDIAAEILRCARNAEDCLVNLMSLIHRDGLCGE